jgi:flagellin-specific chaperone FliS
MKKFFILGTFSIILTLDHLHSTGIDEIDESNDVPSGLTQLTLMDTPNDVTQDFFLEEEQLETYLQDIEKTQEILEQLPEIINSAARKAGQKAYDTLIRPYDILLYNAALKKVEDIEEINKSYFPVWRKANKERVETEKAICTQGRAFIEEETKRLKEKQEKYWFFKNTLSLN